MIREIKVLVRRLFDTFISDVHTHIPCQVVSYDNATNTCSIQPCINQIRFTDPNNLSTINLPVIDDIPVKQFGSGKCVFTVSPQEGSYGWYHVSERAIENWLLNGGIVNPSSARKFNLSDGVFDPGGYTLIEDGDNGLIVEPIETDRISMRTRSNLTKVCVLDDESIDIKVNDKTTIVVNSDGEISVAVNSKATIDIDADGNASLSTEGNIVIETTDGNTDITTDGDTTITSGGHITTSGSDTVIQDGTDWAVQYTALKSAFDTLKTDVNNFVIWATSHVHPGVLAGAASTAVSPVPPVQSSADMTGSKITDVRMP